MWPDWERYCWPRRLDKVGVVEAEVAAMSQERVVAVVMLVVSGIESEDSGGGALLSGQGESRSLV